MTLVTSINFCLFASALDSSTDAFNAGPSVQLLPVSRQKVNVQLSDHSTEFLFLHPPSFRPKRSGENGHCCCAPKAISAEHHTDAAHQRLLSTF